MDNSGEMTETTLRVRVFETKPSKFQSSKFQIHVASFSPTHGSFSFVKGSMVK